MKSRPSVSMFSSSSIGTYSFLSKTLGGVVGFGPKVSATISSSERELGSGAVLDEEATVSGCLLFGSKRKVFFGVVVRLVFFPIFICKICKNSFEKLVCKVG